MHSTSSSYVELPPPNYSEDSSRDFPPKGFLFPSIPRSLPPTAKRAIFKDFGRRAAFFSSDRRPLTAGSRHFEFKYFMFQIHLSQHSYGSVADSKISCFILIQDVIDSAFGALPSASPPQRFTLVSPRCLKSVPISIWFTNQHTLVHSCQNDPWRRHVPTGIPRYTPAKTTIGGVTYQTAYPGTPLPKQPSEAHHVPITCVTLVCTRAAHWPDFLEIAQKFRICSKKRRALAGALEIARFWNC